MTHEHRAKACNLADSVNERLARKGFELPAA
jgi:hypothetical protein